MEIQNSTIEDLDFIFDLYRAATACIYRLKSVPDSG
jgi:hypothetical protein